MAADREINGFWWVWYEGIEWPSWYYSEKVALNAAKTIVRANPGRKVYIGNLVVMKTMLLPDKIIEAAT